jgi:hypothetical protein
MEKKLVDLIVELKKDCMIDEEQIRTLCNVSLSEYKAVMEIKTTERVTCNVLSKKMGLSPSRGSRIVDGLLSTKDFDLIKEGLELVTKIFHQE